MNIEQLLSLIKNGESHTIEFKKSTAQLRPAFETICAFLNVDGGFVMIGVNDKGQMIGQDITDNTRQEIAREISKIEPPAEIKIDYVSIDNNKNIIVIHVEKGMHSPYTGWLKSTEHMVCFF
jgi:ATP-dependent DNA helicase RecG